MHWNHAGIFLSPSCSVSHTVWLAKCGGHWFSKPAVNLLFLHWQAFLLNTKFSAVFSWFVHFYDMKLESFDFSSSDTFSFWPETLRLQMVLISSMIQFFHSTWVPRQPCPIVQPTNDSFFCRVYHSFQIIQHSVFQFHWRHDQQWLTRKE